MRHIFLTDIPTEINFTAITLPKSDNPKVHVLFKVDIFSPFLIKLKEIAVPCNFYRFLTLL